LEEVKDSLTGVCCEAQNLQPTTMGLSNPLADPFIRIEWTGLLSIVADVP